MPSCRRNRYCCYSLVKSQWWTINFRQLCPATITCSVELKIKNVHPPAHNIIFINTLAHKEWSVSCGLNPQPCKSSCSSLPQLEVELLSAFTFLSILLQVNIDTNLKMNSWKISWYSCIDINTFVSQHQTWLWQESKCNSKVPLSWHICSGTYTQKSETSFQVYEHRENYFLCY